MRTKMIPTLLVGAVIVALLAGCNLPTRPTPTAFVLPSAIPSETPLPIPPTATQPPAPTATLPPAPTATVLPSSTALPSNTPIPPTATPSTRAGAHAVAPFMSKAPNFDGVWDEWSAKEYPAKFLVFGTNKKDGTVLDLEGSFRVAWDNTYLYIAAKVHDPVYVQQATGAEIYKGDSLEILIDTDLLGDFSSRTLSGDDYQIGISPGQGDTVGKDPEAYLWYPSSRAGSLSSVKIGATSSEGLYRVEVGIPWKALNTTPTAGKVYGFAFSISYNNTPDTKKQEAMISNVATRVLTDPTTWGSLTLTK